MVFTNQDLLLIALGVGMVFLTIIVIVILINKKCSPTYSSCVGCSSKDGLNKWINVIKKLNGGKSVDSSPEKNGYNDFCRNRTNDNWIKILGKGGKFIEGDPHTNGFYKFCGKNGGSNCPDSPTGANCPTGANGPTGANCPTYTPCSSPDDFINAGGNMSDFYNICCSSKDNWNTLTGNTQSDLNTNGYDLYCSRTRST